LTHCVPAVGVANAQKIGRKSGPRPGRLDFTMAVACYAANDVTLEPVEGCQFHGNSVCRSLTLVRPETTRSSTSVSQAIGSTPFSLAV
jgi:hypothetical protein